jgi:hypothetical protein
MKQRLRINYKKFVFICCLMGHLFPLVLRAEIITPYPETIELKQINDAEKERLRLCQGHKKYDRQPTGFYIERGKKVVVNVEIITPALDDAKPVISIGTLGFNVLYTGETTQRSKTDITLNPGLNTITASQHNGGLIYFSFLTSGSREPQGVARITFTEESEQVRAPRYVYGVTSTPEFKEMLDTYPTPDVIFHSDYVVVAATKEAATSYSKFNNKTIWMNDLHTLLANEDSISGLDNNDPNPLHHRLKAGEVRFLLVENTSPSPHANAGGYTGYPNGSRHRYLTAFTPGTTGNNNSWMLGHEIGHQHQQPAYQINKATESTVNIYSYVEERYMMATVGQSYNRTPVARWSTARSTYLKLPLEERIYDMDDDQLQSITGFNRDELRFMVWEQLFILFGDDFYKNLHRVVREEKVIGGGADERRFYLIWKASMVSGYDLREFFNQWGIRIKSDNELKNKLQTYFDRALAAGTLVELPQTIENVLKITGQQRPPWTPLPLLGITSSHPANEKLDKGDWTITTSIQGAADAAIGGDKPQYIIDGSISTAFAFVKPGLSYGGVTAPANYVPSFTIDMQSPQSFNFFSYQHRTGNTSEWLRARKLSLYGQNEYGTAFQPIVENVTINPTENKDVITIEFPDVSFRYVRMDITDWSTEGGNTIQISEFDLGTTRPEWGTGVSAVTAGKQTWNVYPNHLASGQPFYVRTGDEGKDAVLTVFSVTGAKIGEQTIHKTTETVHLSVPPGIYLLQIAKGTNRTTTKLLVSK